MKLFMDTEIEFHIIFTRNTILFAISIKHKMILIKILVLWLDVALSSSLSTYSLNHPLYIID